MLFSFISLVFHNEYASNVEQYCLLNVSVCMWESRVKAIFVYLMFKFLSAAINFDIVIML